MLLLGGCGGSTAPQTHYYLLATPTFRPSADNADITVTSVTLARYLDQRGLILVSNQRQVNVAQYNFWAEPLDVGILRLMNDEFDDARYPGVGNVKVDIDYFHGDELGNVLLEARWMIELPGSESLTGKNVITRRQATDGYEGLIETQSEMIGDLVAVIFEEYSLGSNDSGR
jgi:uncharacterized lipoprotein YmbA